MKANKGTSIHERFEILIEELGLKRNTFALKLGVATTNVYNICGSAGRKSEPSFDMLARIAKTFPQVSMDWLVSGNGSVFKATDQAPSGVMSEINAMKKEIAKLKGGGSDESEEEELIKTVTAAVMAGLKSAKKG